MDPKASRVDLPRLALGRIGRKALEQAVAPRSAETDWWSTKLWGPTRRADVARRKILFLVCGPEPMISAIAGPRVQAAHGAVVGGVLGEMGAEPHQVCKLLIDVIGVPVIFLVESSLPEAGHIVSATPPQTILDWLTSNEGSMPEYGGYMSTSDGYDFPVNGKGEVAYFSISITSKSQFLSSEQRAGDREAHYIKIRPILLASHPAQSGHQHPLQLLAQEGESALQPMRRFAGGSSPGPASPIALPADMQVGLGRDAELRCRRHLEELPPSGGVGVIVGPPAFEHVPGPVSAPAPEKRALLHAEPRGRPAPCAAAALQLPILLEPAPGTHLARVARVLHGEARRRGRVGRGGRSRRSGYGFGRTS
ncbi:hypothetical protein JB92DRAFT_3109095 [Gautieria morchelliformis]|nr:hypothetical protein JB92DRAFT_3109095 [Gautieria morchelliformis]